MSTEVKVIIDDLSKIKEVLLLAGEDVLLNRINNQELIVIRLTIILKGDKLRLNLFTEKSSDNKKVMFNLSTGITWDLLKLVKSFINVFDIVCTF